MVSGEGRVWRGKYEKFTLHTSKDISRGIVLGCDTVQYYCYITKIWKT